jgi:hypothetical protein
MKFIKRFVFSSMMMFCIFMSLSAFAQNIVPSQAPTSLNPTAVVAVLATLVGVINALVQNGKLFNTWAVGAQYMPVITLVGTFLGGVVSYLKQQDTLVFNSSTILYAFLQGILMLVVPIVPSAVAMKMGGVMNKKHLTTLNPTAETSK